MKTLTSDPHVGGPPLSIASAAARLSVSSARTLIWPTILWLTLAVPALLARPPLVSVESPLHSALWWILQQRPDVPYLPTAPGELPPLFTALLLLAWRLFGIDDLGARLMPGLFVLGSIWLT